MRTLIGGLVVLGACASQPRSAVFTPLAGADGGYVFIGTPCTPSEEDNPSFSGFSRRELSIGSFSGQPIGAPVCLVYHFQGRVSCPYGQASRSAACRTPRGQPVAVGVAPQCLDRRPSEAVVWSCQCGGPPLATGQSYCSCPSGTSCEQAGVDGSYCVPSGTGETAQCSADCQPGVHPCN